MHSKVSSSELTTKTLSMHTNFVHVTMQKIFFLKKFLFHKCMYSVNENILKSIFLFKGMHKFSIPSKAVIESISMSSAGDIRGAINALQFACLKG